MHNVPLFQAVMSQTEVKPFQASFDNFAPRLSVTAVFSSVPIPVGPPSSTWNIYNLHRNVQHGETSIRHWDLPFWLKLDDGGDLDPAFPFRWASRVYRMYQDNRNFLKLEQTMASLAWGKQSLQQNPWVSQGCIIIIKLNKAQLSPKILWFKISSGFRPNDLSSGDDEIKSSYLVRLYPDFAETSSSRVANGTDGHSST